MRFLVDSAKLEEVREAMDMSFVNGVTTNTREMAYNATDNYHAYLKKLRKIARGTIHVQVTVEVPKKLSTRHEELLRELAEIENTYVTPKRKSFVEKIKKYFET